MLEKIKTANPILLWTAGLLLMGALGFGLGRWSRIEEARPPVRVTAAAAVATEPPPEQGSRGAYVASKNGSKYHLAWCSGAQRIKEENKIYFNSQEEAERAGYAPAANCPGI